MQDERGAKYSMQLAFRRTLKEILKLDDIRRVKLQSIPCGSGKAQKSRRPQGDCGPSQDLDVPFEVEVAGGISKADSVSQDLQNMRATEIVKNFINQLLELPPVVDDGNPLGKWTVKSSNELLDPMSETVCIKAKGNDAVPVKISVPEISDITTTETFVENGAAKPINSITIKPEGMTDLKVAVVEVTQGFVGDYLFMPM